METPKIDMLRRAMQAYTWRMEAHASNLANIETPGYQRLSVSFEEELQSQMHGKPSASATAGVDPRVNVEDGPPVLEDELMEMADTQMRTQFTTRSLRDHFEVLRMSITGRSG